MKHQGERLKALMLIALVVFLPAYLSAPAAAAQAVGQIKGVVTDGYEYLIPNATIHLYSLDRVLQTKSDVKGRFRLNNVPAVTYELEVAASGFKTKMIDQVKVSGGSSLSYEMALKMTALDCPPLDSISYEPNAPSGNGVVQGVVLDSGPGGKPISGMEVRLFHTTDKPTLHRTNDRGEFRFSVSTPGRFFIQTARRGYRTVQSQQFWVTGENRTLITMRQIKVGWMIVCE